MLKCGIELPKAVECSDQRLFPKMFNIWVDGDSLLDQQRGREIL